MKFNVHAGHGAQDSKSPGAVGLIKESIETRKVKDEVISLLRKEGHTVYDCTVDYPSSQQDALNKIIKKCNSNNVDLDISIHFNSGANDERGNGNTTGVEVLVYKLGGEAEKVAKRVGNQISKLNLKNRGVKVRNNLAFLKNTKATSLLIECCFVDDKDDVNAYNYKTMAKAIVEGILNKTINKDNTNDTKYTNCILYGNDIDKVSAEVLGWAKDDCIVKNVKDHIAWEGTNLFVVGGPAKNELEKMNTGESYTSIVGSDRYDTIIQVLKNIGKL